MMTRLRTIAFSLLILSVGCRTQVSHEDQYRKRLQSIILPEVTFRDAPIQDVVLFLEAASMDYDPSGKHGEGVTVLIDSQRLHVNLSKAKPITFHATNISLFDTIEAITELAGLEYRIGTSVVIDKLKE